MSRLTEMEAFAAVVEEGGFSDAARKMGVAKSTVSKHISALETRLGTRLLSRSTRRVSPTEIGLAYYDRASRILNDAGEADALVATLHATPAGRLHISAASDFGIHDISPRLGRFLAEYPKISVNLALNNQHIDLISEGFDVAILMGDLNDSTLRARKLCDTRMRLIASNGYLNQFGSPAGLDALVTHQLLHYSNRPDDLVWKLTDRDGTCRQIRIPCGLSVNDGQSLVNAAIDGLGIAYLPEFLCGEALRDGRVIDVIPQLPPVYQAIHAVYPPGRFTQPKVRAFIDFLVAEFAPEH